MFQGLRPVEVLGEEVTDVLFPGHSINNQLLLMNPILNKTFFALWRNRSKATKREGISTRVYYPDTAAATRLQIILIVPKYTRVNLPQSSLRNEDGTKETTELQLAMGEATCMSQLLHTTGNKETGLQSARCKKTM